MTEIVYFTVFTDENLIVLKIEKNAAHISTVMVTCAMLSKKSEAVLQDEKRA